MSYKSNMGWYAEWESEKEDREDAMAEYSKIETQVKIDSAQSIIKKTDEPCKLSEAPYQQLSIFNMLKPVDYNKINCSEESCPDLNKSYDSTEKEEGNSL